jgi:TDG/mug DNA glycosylase family protein
MQTLPDYLQNGLDIVFVGLNPSPHSIHVGHYYGNPRNRFWKALNQSHIINAELSSLNDYQAIYYGVGFTDLVKRPTPQVKDLKVGDYTTWAPLVKTKLLKYQPLIVCFQGVMCYKFYLKYVEHLAESPKLGIQKNTIGNSRIFVTPNPSPANAQYSIDDLSYWYKSLGELRSTLKT